MFLRFLTISILLCWPFSVTAGKVVLTSIDGTLSVEGDLVSFDDEFFRLETEFGPLTLDGGNMRCTGEACPDPNDRIARVRVGGPVGMIHNLMPSLIEVFAERQRLGFRSLFLGDDQIVWELRDPKTDQILAVFEGWVQKEDVVLAQLGDGAFDISLGRKQARDPIRQDVIALDAVVPLVAPENARAMVTQAQLRGLLSGRIASWHTLDGPNQPVALHVLAGTEALLGKWHRGRIDRDATEHASATDLADVVASDETALGIGLYSAIGNAVPLVVGGACGLAIPATRDTIRSEDYPLTQPLFLQRVGARQPKILRDFIAFTRSAEAQPVIEATGFVDQAIGRIAFERQGDRIANAVLASGEDPEAVRSVRDMVAALLDLDRLTLTFRFEDGSSDLDAQSTSNLRRLSDAINRGDFGSKTLLFIGFSDGAGAADGNKRLSLRRAESVRKAISARVAGASITLDAMGYGEVLPMACDDTAWGRQVNRRVEVWID